MRVTWEYDEEKIRELIAKDWNEQNSEETSQVLTKEDITWKMIQTKEGSNTIRFVFETFE